MEVREQRQVLFLQVCWNISLSSYWVVKISLRDFILFTLVYFSLKTGTGSDIKVPKKPEKPKPSHKVNHSSHAHKHSSATFINTGTDSTHTPALRAGSTSPCSKNSQGKQNVPIDSPSTNQDAVDIAPAGQNKNSDCDAAKPDTNTSNSASFHQHRDKNSARTSPQKHREKRKHCDSDDLNKRKHKKHKRSRDARFEGHRISHLVKKRTFKKSESEDNAAEDQKKSDDYVLAKLFKKSGRSFFWLVCLFCTVCSIRNFYIQDLRNGKLLFLIFKCAVLFFHGVSQVFTVWCSMTPS